MHQWNPEFIRRATTQKSEDRDFTEWHRGRQRYLVWAIQVEDSGWQQCLQQARLALGDILLPGEARCAHITLYAAGFACDESTRSLVETQKQRLQQSRFERFELQLGPLNSFSSAVYYSLIDKNGNLMKLHHQLQLHQEEERSEPYTPHMTVGLYNDAYPVTQVIQQLGRLELKPFSRMQVRRLSLMSYDTRSVFSPLICEQQIELI